MLGVLLDERPEEEKEKDYNAEEVLPQSSVVDWRDKEIDQLKKVNRVKSQGQAGTCVAQTKATQLEWEVKRLTGEWIELSPLSIYKHRVNTTPGMWVSDALNIVKKKGATLEAFLKSENLTEHEATIAKMTTTANAYAKALTEIDLSYLYLPTDIDRIATALEMGHAVGLILFATRDEYTNVPYIKNPNLNWTTATIRHAVTALDYFIYNGKKALWIVDSWGVGTGQGGYRIITEDFMPRITTADYFDRFILDKGNPQKYDFYMNLKFGDRNDQVVLLQNFLKERGYFPVNQASTGYYGSITANAVLRWQIDNNVDTKETLTRLQGKHFGPKSRQVANS